MFPSNSSPKSILNLSLNVSIMFRQSIENIEDIGILLKIYGYNENLLMY